MRAWCSARFDQVPKILVCLVDVLARAAQAVQHSRYHAGVRNDVLVGTSFLSGLLFLLSFPPFFLAPLIWVALVPLLLVRHRLQRMRLLLASYLMAMVPIAGIGYNLAVFDVGAFAVLVLAVPAAFALAILAADALERRCVGSLTRLLVFPSMAVAIEYFLVSVGAPATIALSQASMPTVIQSADVFGIPGITFLIVLVNCGFERALVCLDAWRHRERDFRNLRAVALSAALLLADLLYGHVALRAHRLDRPAIRIASVQPSISTEMYRERWFRPQVQTMIDEAVEALMADAIATGPTLLFLSEGGNGRYNFRVPQLREHIASLARQSKAGLLLASPDMTPKGEELNAVFSVAHDGRLLGRYAKGLLTPVGEEQLTAGVDRRLLETEVGAVGAMVCFESCFPRVARELVRKGASFLLVSTSDASFRNGSMPFLHSAFTIFRAVETRRYVVQAANTGPSLVVSPTGEIEARSPFLAATVLSGAIAPSHVISMYTHMGDSVPCMAIVGLFVGAVNVGRRGWRNHRQHTHGRGHRARALTVRSMRTCTSGVGRVLASGLLYTGALAGMIALSIRCSTAMSGQSAGTVASVVRFLTPPEIPGADRAVESLRQSRANTCGPAALAFALRFYGIDTTEDAITALVEMDAPGTNMLELVRAAEHYRMRALGQRLNVATLRQRRQPTIAHIAGNHFLVVIEVRGNRVLLFDPALGLVQLPVSDFARLWNGYALTLWFPPTPELDGERGPVLAHSAAEDPRGRL